MNRKFWQGAIRGPEVIGGGGGADLASALLMAGNASGPIQQKEPAEQLEKKPEAKEPPKEKAEEKPEAKEEKKDDGSGLVGSITEALKNKEATGDILKKPEEKEEKVEQKEEPKKSDLEEVEDPGVGNIKGVSQTIKEKLQRFHGQAKKFREVAEKSHSDFERVSAENTELKKQVETGSRQLTDVKASEEFKAIQGELETYKKIVEKVSLENSPEFKSKYEKKIEKTYKSVESLIKTSTDAPALSKRLASAMMISPGESGDAEFYEAIGEISEKLKGGIQAPFVSKMSEIREIANERAEAISNVGDTAKAMEGLRSEEIQHNQRIATDNLDKIFDAFESTQAANIAQYRKHKDVYQYDELVGPGVALAKEEVSRTISAGVPTPRLLALAVNGAHYPFLATQVSKYHAALERIVKENDELKAQMKKLSNGDGSGGKATKPSDTGEKTPDKYHKGSAILDTLKEMQEANKS